MSRRIPHDGKRNEVAPPCAKKQVALPSETASSTTAITTQDDSNYTSIFGSTSRKFAIHLVRQLAEVMPSRPERDTDELIELTLALERAIQPRDEIEAMLAAQMIGVHNTLMTCLGRANISGISDQGAQLNIEWANKLARTFSAQLESLNRHRGKGQQKVTVEHVTVNQGGQAVIGVLEKGKGRGGGGDGRK